MAKIFRANGNREDIEYEGPNETLTIDQLQKVIDGYVEVIKVPNSHNILIVDEEGRFKDKPINVTASKLAQREIVGDVVLCTYLEFK